MYMVPGSLRSSVSAVVLRRKIQTSTIRQIFATRIDGKYIAKHFSYSKLNNGTSAMRPLRHHRFLLYRF